MLDVKSMILASFAVRNVQRGSLLKAKLKVVKNPRNPRNFVFSIRQLINFLKIDQKK